MIFSFSLFFFSHPFQLLMNSTLLLCLPLLLPSICPFCVFSFTHFIGVITSVSFIPSASIFSDHCILLLLCLSYSFLLCLATVDEHFFPTQFSECSILQDTMGNKILQDVRLCCIKDLCVHSTLHSCWFESCESPLILFPFFLPPLSNIITVR